MDDEILEINNWNGRMVQRIAVIFFILLTECYVSEAQTVFQTHAGIGYMEHFSLGAGLNISEKHSLSFLYGSNLFIRPKDFSTYLLQYNLLVTKLRFYNFTPIIGVKGGITIFTDEYYRWNLVAIIPFAGIEYPFNKKINLQMHAGCAFSLEQSVQRIKDGEIGHYREQLPEIKASVLYNFLR